MMGIYFNLSFWYKIIDKTIWGAWFSGIGCAVLLAVNIIFVPKYGYMACAWGGVAGYGVAMVVSYIVGQKYYPLNYPLKDIAIYVILAIVLTASMYYIPKQYGLGQIGSFVYNTLCIIFYLSYILHTDLPLSKLPIIGKKFKK
jgi:O-antigen/teichoic acid export membrane protein